MIKDFLSKYDSSHNLEFNQIKFRPGAKMVAGFGIDTSLFSKKRIRLHLGTDSTWSHQSGYRIYCPFDIVRTEYKDEPTPILTLYTDYDFIINLKYINIYESKEVREKILKGSGFKAGDPIGSCGSIGTKNGVHLHTEIISINESSDLIDAILKEKYEESLLKYNYSEKHILSLLTSASLNNNEGIEILRSETNQNNIQFLNNYKGIINNKTYYNSLTTFGF